MQRVHRLHVSRRLQVRCAQNVHARLIFVHRVQRDLGKLRICGLKFDIINNCTPCFEFGDNFSILMGLKLKTKIYPPQTNSLLVGLAPCLTDI
jgi:hypothetical protein